MNTNIKNDHVQVRLSTDQKERLKSYAKNYNTTISEVIRIMVESVIKSEVKWKA